MNHWEQIEKLCQSALELEESRRGAFLDQACAGDAELRREVESLLRFETRGKGFIEEPALEVTVNSSVISVSSVVQYFATVSTANPAIDRRAIRGTAAMPSVFGSLRQFITLWIDRT